MTCRELLRAIGEHVDGAVDPELCEEFAKHLAGCNPCQVVVDNIRRTIRLYQDGKPFELPPGFCQAMRAVLQHRWKQTHTTLTAG